MALEIERKFLVNRDLWIQVIPQKTKSIKQGYLSADDKKVVRVRVSDDKGFLTIKGKAEGIVRQEYEYEIPLADAENLLKLFCSKVVVKFRHIVNIEGHIWEVDEFKEANEGLLMAEIELKSTEEAFIKPDWAGEDVSEDYRYTNSYLAENPYKEW